MLIQDSRRCLPRFLCFFVFMLLITDSGLVWAGQAGYSIDSGELGAYQTPQQKDGAGKKLLAVYVVGSDLESNGGAATTDFNELIAGYNALNNPGAVDIIVAFGGADQNGWRGMRFADINQLVQDSGDGVYGNATYLYKAENAHMGDQSSLQQFLEYVKEGYINYDHSALVFWDHGASYGGFGNDENFNYDLLSLTEIKNGLEQSGVGTFDLIGFDACLMGSAEVARFVKSSASYMMASEELEPGHGWNWTTVINEYALRDSIPQALTNMINNFIGNVHNYQSDGKTLSAVKLNNYVALWGAIDAFARDVAANISSSSDYREAMIYAVTNVRDFGKESREDQRVSVDLKDLVTKFRNKVTDTNARQLADALLSQIEIYVLHTGQDGSRPNSYGVSIAPVEGAVGNQTAQYMVSTGWIQLQRAYKQIKSQDTSEPEVAEFNSNANSSDYEWDFDDGWEWYYEDDDAYYAVIDPAVPPFLRGERAAFVPNGNFLRDVAGGSGVRGVSATFSDDNLTKVTTIFGFELDYGEDGVSDPYFLSVAEMEAYPTTTEGQYFTPAWNKKWYTVKHDPNAPMTEWMPMVFQQRYVKDEVTYTEYTAEIDYYQTGKDYSGYDFPADLAFLRIIVDGNNQVVNHSVQTYKIFYDGPDDMEGRVQIDKATRQIQPGDKVQFWTYGFHMTNPERDDWFETSDVITFTQAPEFGVEVLVFEAEEGSPLAYKYAMWAEDINGNGVLTTPAEAGDETGGDDDNDNDHCCFIGSLMTTSTPGSTPVGMLLAMIFSGAAIVFIKTD